MKPVYAYLTGWHAAVAGLVFIVSSLAAVAAPAQPPAVYGETGTGTFDNLRWTIDLSARGTYMNDMDDWEGQYAIGLDLHKVFTGPGGDIGTLVFQPYLVRLDNSSYPPFFFDDGDDWELVWRIANFNYTALARGRFNIRLGHFEVPFGLEQNIDTNGTLRQYTFPDRGIKVDWGASVNGVLTKLEYELSVTRGSGNEIHSAHDPWLVAGRLGSRSDRNLIAGLSFLRGEILGGSGTTERTRAGVDLAWYRGPVEILFELSGGEDDDSDTINGLAELSVRNPMETLHGWLQLRHTEKDTATGTDSAGSAAIGLAWEPDRHWSSSCQWIEPLGEFSGMPGDSKFQLQVRYRF